MTAHEKNFQQSKKVPLLGSRPPLLTGQYFDLKSDGNDSQSSNTELIDLERDHTRYPEKLDAFLYTIGLDQIPGWKMDSRTRKVSLSKAGRSWVRRMCYLLGRKNMDCNPFLEHLGTIFDAEEMIRIMEVTEKTIDKVYMKKDERPNNAEVYTDEESLKLAKIANFLKYTDVPGAYIDRVSSRKLIGPESIPFLQKIIRRMMQKNLPALESLLIKISDMFRCTVHMVFTKEFRREIDFTLLHCFTQKVDVLHKLMQQAMDKEKNFSVENKGPRIVSNFDGSLERFEQQGYSAGLGAVRPAYFDGQARRFSPYQVPHKNQAYWN